jgi:hypothetical protein
MSTTPLTDKAMLRLKALCEGNGVEPKHIELIGTEETPEYTLRGEMVLTLDVANTRTKMPGSSPGPKRNARVLNSVNEIQGQVTTLKSNLLESGDWVKEASEQLKNEPGQGFGLQNAETTLENLSQTFQVIQSCETCHGAGSKGCDDCKGLGLMPCKICNASGFEVCYQCQGTGKNIHAQGLSCPQCHGRGQIQISNSQTCPQCGGRGHIDDHGHSHSCQQCHGRGQVQMNHNQSCPQCSGRGTLPPTLQQQTCQICNGQMRILCRTCLGKKEIACPTCNGKGKTTCASCQGAGKFTIEELALPVARGDFHLLDTANVPSTLRHALDRYGFKLLVKSGAKVDSSSLEKQENKTARMAYSAAFPFAEARLRIAGKPMRAGIVGPNAAIRDIPPFLDIPLDIELQKLEKKITQSGTMARAFKIRALRELFEITQAGGDVALNFRKLYPIGISATMFAKMQGFLSRLIEASTFTLRATVAGVMLLLLSGSFVGIIGSPIRAHIAAASFPAAAYIFDAFICGISFVIVNLTLRLASALYVRSMAPHKMPLNISAQHAGSLGIGVGACALFIYAALIWFLKATPGFQG